MLFFHIKCVLLTTESNFFCFQAWQWPTLEDMPFPAPFSWSTAFGWQWNTFSATTGGLLSLKGGKSCRLSSKEWSTLRGDLPCLLHLLVSFSLSSSAVFQISQTCSRLISFGLLSCSRYYGWTVCGGWAACPPLWWQFMGQADELAAQHHVSVLWDLWDRHCCQYRIHTGAGWCWPPCHLLGSFRWRYVFSHTLSHYIAIPSHYSRYKLLFWDTTSLFWGMMLSIWNTKSPLQESFSL